MMEDFLDAIAGLFVLAIVALGTPLAVMLYVRYLIWAWGATA